jgi:hypothetical protein
MDRIYRIRKGDDFVFILLILSIHVNFLQIGALLARRCDAA